MGGSLLIVVADHRIIVDILRNFFRFVLVSGRSLLIVVDDHRIIVDILRKFFRFVLVSGGYLLNAHHPRCDTRGVGTSRAEVLKRGCPTGGAAWGTTHVKWRSANEYLAAAYNIQALGQTVGVCSVGHLAAAEVVDAEACGGGAHFRREEAGYLLICPRKE